MRPYGNPGISGNNRSGSAYIFVRSGTEWSQQATLLALDGGTKDRFGCAVSLSGETALVGAYTNDASRGYAGSAYVFARNGSEWNQQAKLIPGDSAANEFGRAVTLSGDTALIGAPGDGDDGIDAGAAYVFVKSGTEWIEQSKFTRGDGSGYNRFGWTVSLSGDTAMISSISDSNENGPEAGAVYVFVRDGSIWSPQAKLTPFDESWASSSSADAPILNFGISLSLDGDTAIVLTFWEVNENSPVYVFTRNGTEWSQQAKLKLAEWFYSFNPTDWRGATLSLSGDTALIGAPRHEAAYVFVRTGTQWTEQARLKANDPSGGDEFGLSVSLDGDIALIGAHRDDDNGTDSGSAYVFQRIGTEWSQQAKLLPDDGESGDGFGWAVSLSGESALIGAFADDDNGIDSGSAYVFVYNGAVWSQQAKLTPADGASNEFFGGAVSLSGGTALIGATGVFPPVSNPGSAYVLHRNGADWDEAAKLVPVDEAPGSYFGVSVSLSGDTALIGAPFTAGFDSKGYNTLEQGSAHIYRLSFMGASSDGDSVSDAWEAANGFDINVAHDHVTKDSDGDGIIDLWEIFQGTDRFTPGDGYGLLDVTADGVNQTLSARVRMDTSQTAVIPLYRWSTDLVDWHAGGISTNGVQVNFSQEVVETNGSYQIVEVSAQVVHGQPKQLFLTIQLLPVE